MPNLFTLACKEVNGNIYVTRLPKAIDDHTPGIPDQWHFVGPGSRPSVQEYNGTQFALMFDYLSHLFVRIFDIATWPPTQVNPVQTSGGPNPPSAFTYNIQLAQDSLAIKTQSSGSNSLVQAFNNPPLLQQPIIFLDPLSNTYSVTIQPIGGWVPQVPANVVPFYRLYRRTFTPVVGSWTMIDNWQTTLNFTDSNVGSLRFQYSATWGSQFLATDPFNSNVHAEGIVGQTYITVDSTVGNLNFQFLPNESLTLDRTSGFTQPFLGQRQLFIVEAPDDAIQLSKSSLGKSNNSFAFFDVRQAFIHNVSDDSLIATSFSNAYKTGNALQAAMG